MNPPDLSTQPIMSSNNTTNDALSAAFGMLCGRQYNETIATLRTTLSMLLSHVDGDEENGRAHRHHKGLMDVSGHDSSSDDEALQVLPAPIPTVTHSFCLYNRFLRFADGTTNDEIFHRGDDNLTLASSLVMYNTALTYHIIAITSFASGSLEQDAAFSKALKIYDMALSAYRSSAKQLQASDQLVILAVLNNMAHIHSQRTDTEQLQVTLEWLQAVLATCAGDSCCEVVHFRLTAHLLHELSLSLWSTAPAA